MRKHNTPKRDRFAFSRGGMSTLVGYVGIPVVANDRLNKNLEQHQDGPAVNGAQDQRRPLWRRRKAA